MKELYFTRKIREATVKKGFLFLLMAIMLTAGVATADETRVGFVYVSPIGDAGWSYAHDQGRLAVGVYRLGNVGGVGGSGELMRVTFTSVASGGTGISFEAFGATQPNGNAIPGVTFSGGSASVQR